MRPGPAAQVLAGPTRVTPVVTSEFRGEFTPITASNVQVEASTGRGVQARLTLTAPPAMVPTTWDAPLACYGQRLHVAARVSTTMGEWDIKIGVYQVESWEENDDGTVQVEALDLTQRLEKNPMLWPSSPPEGATLASELQRLAGEPDDGGIPTAVTGNRAITRAYEWGTSRLEAIQKLLESVGMTYLVTPEGVLLASEPTTLGVAVESYTGLDLLLRANRKSRPRGPNRWMVTGNQQGEANTAWSAVVDNFEDPRYRASSYGVVTDRNAMDIADTEDALYAAAETYKRNALAASGARSLQIVMDPRLELGDVIDVSVTHGETPETLRGRVTGYSMTLDDPAQTMRVDVEVNDGQ